MHGGPFSFILFVLGVTMGKTLNLTLRVPEELHIKMNIQWTPFKIRMGRWGPVA
jgi:hypothetical protein